VVYRMSRAPVTRPRGVTFMNRYSLTHVADSALLHGLRSLLARERAATAELLAHLAEVDARHLYAAAGYPSMFAWCVEELHLSEDSACKRIRAARAARQFPALFAMLADGRLHLSAMVMLAPCLTPGNAEDFLAAATHRSKARIEQLLAERFPRPDLPARIEDLAAAPAIDLSAPGRMKFTGDKQSAAIVRPGVAPLAPGRYGLQLTVSQDTYEKLRHAQALLGHAVPAGELAEVFDRALDALIARLEFDHIEPVARGGRASVSGVRLRCRAHNQYAAECAFGAGFMSRKREMAQRASEESARTRAAAAEEARALAAVAAEEARARAAAAEEIRSRATAAAAEVVPWLRVLGLRAEEARRAAEPCQAIPDATLEERLRCALRGWRR
jgi:hypothetical protein